MTELRVDGDANLSCWNCRGRYFLAPRTDRGQEADQVTVGISALATEKRLKCQRCGRYNLVGDEASCTEPRSPARSPSPEIDTTPSPSAWTRRLSEQEIAELSRARGDPEAEPAPGRDSPAAVTDEPAEKVCPFCAETIKAAAIKCKHCGEFLPEADEPAHEFDVVLACVGPETTSVIKELHASAHLGLKEAEELVGSAPSPVLRGVSKAEADRLRTALERAGATVELR